MAYQTVFEIGLRSFPWSGLLRPALFIAVGLILLRFGRNKQIYMAAGIIVAAMATLFVLVLAVILVPEFVRAHHDYKSGGSSMVEGTVEDFRPAPDLGPAKESFSVGGVRFSYNALDMTACFHNAPFRHGPISAGASVRLLYKNGCIQRVDIRR